jgi:hypothetical protein
VSMYLPNPDLQPTGSEPGEFIAAEFIEAHRTDEPSDSSHDEATEDTEDTEDTNDTDDVHDIDDDVQEPRDQTGGRDANGKATR